MEIGKDCVVRFHYRLFDEAGEALENSHDGEPLTYLHGHDGIISGLQQGLAGHVAGDSFSVMVSPAEGYGERHDNAERRISKKAVVTKGKLRPGMVILVKTDQGNRQAQVIKVGHSVVDIDTNHPLAGKTLRFDIEVVEVREASDEERAHGHVHGPGGHHH